MSPFGYFATVYCRSRGFTSLLLVVLLCFAQKAVLHGLDYDIKPVPPNLINDAATSFLVDLTSAKTQADAATGNPALSGTPSGFVVGSGYTGTMTFASAGNLDPSAFTIEMIVRLPSSPTPANPVRLGGWTSTTSSWVELILDAGFGSRMRLYTWTAGSNLLAQPYAGGNGFTIHNQATDRWVYLTFGVDFAAEKTLVIARDLDGSLINKNINFAGAAGVDTSFLSAYPVAQQPAELSRRWGVLASSITSGMPPQITLGGTGIQTRAIRISRGFRNDVLVHAANVPVANATTWVPQTIDPARTVSAVANRTVGYVGYNNFLTMPVSETSLRLTPGSGVATVQLGNLPVGLYTLYVYGAIEANGRTALDRVWKPCPMDFVARDALNVVLARGRMLLKQSLIPRRMQGFHIHVDAPGIVTATFAIPASASETPLIQKIVLVDQLAGLPDSAVKKAQNLAAGSVTQLASLTSARQTRDDAIWSALPPLNTQLQVHAQVAEFRTPPSGVTLHNWVDRFLDGVPAHRWAEHTFDPLDFLDKTTNTVFPHASVLAGTPWPGPFSDDGTGVFFPKSVYPTSATNLYASQRAEMLGARYLLYAGSIMDSRGSFYGLNLGQQYFANGDANIGHDGAMALVRWAYDWPALEMNLHEHRLSTHSPDLEFNTDWSTVRNGKMYYEGWSGSNTLWLFETYDKLYPYIKGNQVFADAVHRFVPWVHTPQDVVRLLDRFLMFSSVRDIDRGIIDGSANVPDLAARVLGPDPLTVDLFNLTTQHSDIYPATGTYQELYATALSRSGCYYIASFMVYAFGDAQGILEKARLFKWARDAGMTLPMDLSDIERYAKVRSAGNFILDMWVAGGFPFMVGDASGGPHSRVEATARLTAARAAVQAAFDLIGDPRHAWVLKNIHGSTDTAVVAAAVGQSDPVLHARSRVVPDYGAIIEAGSQETDLRRKSALTLRLGIGQGHSHHDYLDLNIFGFGLPLAVDLACRNEGDNWSRPGAGWSFLHNHALAHATNDPSGAGNQSGEPWLRSFAPPAVQASYIDSAGAVQLDRDAILMDIAGTSDCYVFDVQRLRGGSFHTWSFHGAESQTLDVSVSMTAQTVRWIDRTLPGTHFTGTASDTLQATWTMSRTGQSIPHFFNGGGTITTVGAEPTSLGTLYDASLSPVRVRATLLGHGGDTVLQGNPYSQNYAYCFPFLWVQRAASGDSVYPAVYEWYRGTTPRISSTRIVSSSPLQVEVQLASGQQDLYESHTDGSLCAVSHDASGFRWAKFIGAGAKNLAGVAVNLPANHTATIVAMDYRSKQLTTDADLPANPYVIAGNSGRKIFLQLTGSGRNYSWKDDLLIHEGRITSLTTPTADGIVLATNQSLLFGNMGNRKLSAFTVINEDGSWHFRNGTAIKRPSGATLTASVFSDANGDGFINAKTYEIGLGDNLSQPSEVTLRRVVSGYESKSNVSGTVTIGSQTYTMTAGSDWLPLVATGGGGGGGSGGSGTGSSGGGGGGGGGGGCGFGAGLGVLVIVLSASLRRWKRSK